MGWFWNAFGTQKAERPSMTKQTSVRVQQFERSNRRGSLVLSEDDLKVLQIQGKIDRARRKLEHQRNDQTEELQILRNVKETLLHQLDKKLPEDLGDLSVYKETIQEAFLQETLLLAEPGDGMKEAELFQALHKSGLKDKVRVLFQQQASDELMEIYKTGPKFRERMGEREAKMLSEVFQRDALLAQRKDLNERILRIQTEMMARLEKASQEEFQKRYEAIRDGNDAEDGDLVTRSQQAEGKSYSDRVLRPSPKLTEQKKPNMGSLQEVAIDDDRSTEARIGEVKQRTTTTTTSTSVSDRRRGGGATSRSPMRPTSSANTTNTTTTTGRSRSPVPPSRRGETTSRTTAATTNRVRARPAPPSSRSGGAAADRSPTRQTTRSEEAAARRAADERARLQQTSKTTTFDD
jgi:hypothetical protein